MVKRRKFPTREQMEKNRKTPIRVLSKINWKSFEENKKHILEDGFGEMDRVYRIYHHSFKMFNFGSDVIERLVKILDVFDLYSFKTESQFIKDKLIELNLSEKEAQENLEFRKNYNNYRREYHNEKVKYISKQLEKLGIKKTYKRQLKKLKKMFFTLENNNPQLYDWDYDSMEMVGLYTITKNISRSIFFVLEDIKHKRGWFWDDDKRIIDYNEALSSSTFYSFDIRSTGYELREEIRKSIMKSFGEKIEKRK